MESFGTVNVKLASPLVLETALFKFCITALPDTHRKFTCVPAG